MQLNVEHIDSAGVLSEFQLQISLPRFLKHAALAGQGPGALFPTLSRGIGLLLYYQQYIQVGTGFALTGLNAPAAADPTELGDFSTIAGKAFADLLAKFLVPASFTFTYEAVLSAAGQPIVGVRPDFYCISPLGQFSIESKGRSSATAPPSLIMEAKRQARSGALPVGFCFASIAYNLYNSPHCLFYDPVLMDTPINHELHRTLIRDYHNQIIRDLFSINQRSTRRINQRDFFTFPFNSRLGRIEFLVDRQIEGYLLNNDANINIFEPLDEERIYVDRDGIGVLIG